MTTVSRQNSTSNNTIEINNAGQLINEQTTATTTTAAIKSQNLYLLFLLLIPFVFFLVFTFLCCCGRRCLSCVYHIFSINLCSCYRPDKKGGRGKKYDSIFCYGELDEHWLEETFIPKFSEFDRGFKIHKLKLSTNYQISKDHIERLNSTKRIVIIFIVNSSNLF